MKFGVQWTDGFPRGREDLAFHGRWSRSVVAQFVWYRMKCYNKRNHGSQLYQSSFGQASQSTTTITDIDWSNLGGSEVLSQLREGAGNSGGDLAVRISLFYHTNNYPPYVAHNATLGYVVGVIGVPSPSDTLTVPGERAMFFKGNPVGMAFHPGDLCYGQNISVFGEWTNFTPFEVDSERNEVRLDLSNSLSSDISNSVRDIGVLRLGVQTESCVHLLGDKQGLPYVTDNMHVSSGIHTIRVEPHLMDKVNSNPLVVAQVWTEENGGSVVCRADKSNKINIILQEYPYFIRPKSHYVDLLDRHTHPKGTETVYVTKYGAPMIGETVNVIDSSVLGSLGPVIPADGVIPTHWSSTTDQKGLVTFEFTLNEQVRIPPKRHYTHPPCQNSFYRDNRTTLPIDGQVYFFYYCVDASKVSCNHYSYISTYFLAFSDMEYVRPYTWKKDVGPILFQYSRMAPIMKQVLDLGSYDVVTRPQYLRLLNLTLRMDVDSPSYMPVSRDLSPVKRNMILEWLADPKFSLSIPHFQAPPQTCNASIPMRSFRPTRCCQQKIYFHALPQQYDPYFERIFQHRSMPFTGNLQRPFSGRPLFDGANCSIASVKKQLQQAIELEWTTIPVYLTSLYSIKYGRNAEIYELIRSVIVQEMLHMTQAANILIAMGGSPLIDDPSVIPSFPTIGLAGGVLPSLLITLEKLSLEHVYWVFMAIEVPERSLVGLPAISNKHTIGEFYKEIRQCIGNLGDHIFDPSSVNLQVKWPWVSTRDVGNLVPVTNVASAQRAIDVVVSQGEGSSILNPDELGSHTLAHFFKFEEIVCQRHLEKVEEFYYAYNGPPIQFDPDGVWPVRTNPKASTVPPDTNCYTQSRVFHQVYRMLLRKLQSVFNGHPEDIFMTVQLMKSMQVHARKLAWTKLHPDDPDDDTTCGPVWDYFWPEDEMP